MRERRGEVVAVRDLFAKYKNTLIAPQKTVELETVRVIGEMLHFSLKEEAVAYTVSTRTVYIQVSGMMKQEIKIKGPEIIAQLKKRLGNKNAPEVIL